MWVGTQEGLNIFDGNQFQHFSKSSAEPRRLGGIFVEELLEDKKKGWIWVLTSQGDICAIDPETRVIRSRINRDQHGRLLSDRWCRSIAVIGDTLLVGGSETFFGINLNNGKYLNFEPLLKSYLWQSEFNIVKLVVDPSRRIWVMAEGYGVIQLNNKFTLEKSYTSELSNHISQTRKLRFWSWTIQNDCLYAATSWGIRRFNISESFAGYIPNTNENITDSTEIRTICFPSQFKMLLSTPEGFYMKESGKNKLIRILEHSENKEWFNYIFSMHYDHKYERMWLGSSSGLASFPIDKAPFAAFSRPTPDGEYMRQLFSLLVVPGKEIICGDEAGLYSVSADLNSVKKIQNTNSNYLLFLDRQGNIITSNKAGLFLLEKSKLIPIHARFKELKPLNDHLLSCGVQFNDSIIVFASSIQKGLSVWNTNAKTVKTYHKNSINYSVEELNYINNLYKSINGELFIITKTSLIKFNPVTEGYSPIRIFNKERQEYYSNFMDMCEDMNGYYIATYGSGLVFVDKKFNALKYFTTENGLSNNCLYRVFNVNGSVVATSNIGLSVVDKKTFFVNTYFKEDGLHSDNFEQLCGYRQGNIIYSGGLNGFTRIDADLLASNTVPPKLYVTGFELKLKTHSVDSNNLFLKKITIPNDILQTTIRMTGINYLNPGRVIYSYKLNTSGNEWVFLGKENHINLIGLSPGEHKLTLRAANESGVWSKENVELILTVLPKWYQTVLFKIIVILMVVGLIYGAFRFRLNQLKKQHEIRQEISRDLHDDIGSTLNSVKIFTHLARNNDESEFYFSQIEESVNRASFGLRDMIWVLEDKQDSVYDLMERIKKFALPVCYAKGIEFSSEIKADRTYTKISKSLKKNLLLIAKEAINNSIKYSACTKIDTILLQQRKKFMFIIRDNGKGFTNEVTRGNGLTNMEFRAKQVGFDFEIASNEIDGTKITLVKNY